MIIKCENCGTQYNEKTINHCPACQRMTKQEAQAEKEKELGPYDPQLQGLRFVRQKEGLRIGHRAKKKPKHITL